ncbi:MucBP domain-containing protein [Anaerotruncus colihominis]|nr:MucBP domain-containing protein [Anaerotruncus colihominis]MCR2025652.1 MucBP domain-containing protein [Anaerotruncus colihominis]
MNAEALSVWEQIQADFQDENRTILFSCMLRADTENVEYSFSSYDKKSAQLSPATGQGNDYVSLGYKSSSSYSVRFLYDADTGDLSYLKHVSETSNRVAYAEYYKDSEPEPPVWYLRPSYSYESDPVFSDIKGFSFGTPAPAEHTLTIQYQYENGSQAAEPAIRFLAAGDSYEVVSPVLSGYTADKPTVSGTMSDNDLTITVTYTAMPPTTTEHTLTIQYQYEDGSQAAEPAVKTYQAGAAYQVVSPVLNGYTADKPTVSGMMPDSDLTITVIYTKSSGGTGSDDPWDISPGTDWSSPFEWYDVTLNATWGSPFNWFDISPDTQWHSTFPWS